MTNDHLMGVYNRAPVALSHGQGVWITDEAGTTYLDCVSGIATDALGHSHPKLVAALAEQAGKLWHVSNIFRIPGQDALAKRLTDATFADATFFGNSGSEAIECALKTARRYHSANGQPERIDVIGPPYASTLSGGQVSAVVKVHQRPGHRGLHIEQSSAISDGRQPHRRAKPRWGRGGRLVRRIQAHGCHG